MAIHVDVLTRLDARSLEQAARTLESRLTQVGRAGGAGTSALKALDDAQKSAAISADRLAIAHMKFQDIATSNRTSALQMAQAHVSLASAQQANERAVSSLASTQTAYFTSLRSGAMVALGAVTALAAGTVAALAGVGEQFENINRQIVTSTGASGATLDTLNSQAKQVMSSVDTSVKQVGSDLGVLKQRLGMVAGDASLTKLAEHVSEVRDRFGGLDIRTFTGDMVQFGVAGKDVDDTLASLMNTSMATDVPLNELLSGMAMFGETLQQANLNIEQSARLIGRMDTILGPGGATKAMTGFARAEQSAAKMGLTFQQFLVKAGQSIQAYLQAGDQANAQEMMEKIFGVRNWPQAQAILQSYLDIVNKGPDAWRAQASEIDDVSNRTKTLGNYWDEVRNKINVALAPPGQTAVDVVGKKMEDLATLITAHQDDLRSFFEGALDAITGFVGYLAKVPGLVIAIGTAFAAWKVGEIVAGVTKAIAAMNIALAGSEVAGGAAATGLAATTAAVVPLAAAFTALAAAIAISIADIVRGAQKGWDWYMGHSPIGLLTGHPPHEGETPSGPTHTAPPGSTGTFYSQWYQPPAPAVGPPVPGEGPPEPTPPALPGAGGPPEITPEDLDNAGKGPRLPQAPEIPYGAEFAAPPRPGESAEQYAAEGRILEARHKVEEDRARLQQLEATNTATAEDIGKARNKLAEDERALNSAQLEANEKQIKNLSKTTKDLDEFGVKLDQDFGISKGLPGMAENLTRFLANLVAAPVFGALGGAKAALGGPTGGASGLIGMGALANLSPEQQMMLYANAASGGGGGGFPGSGYGGLNSGFPGGFPWPYPSGLPTQYPGGSPYPYAPGVYGPANGAAPTNLSGNKAAAYQAMLAAGWGPDQWPALEQIIAHESGFSTTARNPSSGAYGMYQFLGHEGDKYGAMGAYSSDPAAQSQAGMAYIADRYGSPDAAWAFWQAHNWYEHGGAVPITAHVGEHVLTRDDVNAMGGQAGVYAFRRALHYQGGGAVLPFPVPVDHGKIPPNAQVSQPTGLPGLLGVGAPSAPPAPPPPPALPAGPPAAPAAPGAPPRPSARPGTTAPAPPPPPEPGPDTTMIGGLAPPKGYGPGFQITGGGLLGMLESLPSTAVSAAAMTGGAMGGPGGVAGGGAASSVISAAIDIGIQELNRGIAFGAQTAGIAASGLMETFLPAGASELANNSWLTRFVGGVIGAKPMIPNVAGSKVGPKDLTPEQAAAFSGGQPHLGTGGAPGAGGPAAPSAPLLNIENYTVSSTEDRAAADLLRHWLAAYNSMPVKGGR